MQTLVLILVSFQLVLIVFAARKFAIRLRKCPSDKGSWCNVKTCSLKRLNSITSRLDLNIAVLKDLPETALVDIVGNERIGNRYVRNGFAVRKDINLCEMLQNGEYLKVAEKHPGLPNGCPVQKGNYTLRNYRIDESGLPESLPVQDNWRVDITVKNSGKKLCSNHVFAYIDHSVGRNSG